MGIGLSVVKKLVEMHGGSVQAFSDGLGKGSEFVITLPLATEPLEVKTANGSTKENVIQSAQLKMPNDPASGSKEKPRRMLVVDDNDDAAVMLATLLSMQGHSIRVAHDGKSAPSKYSRLRVQRPWSARGRRDPD